MSTIVPTLNILVIMRDDKAGNSYISYHAGHNRYSIFMENIIQTEISLFLHVDETLLNWIEHSAVKVHPLAFNCQVLQHQVVC